MKQRPRNAMAFLKQHGNLIGILLGVAGIVIGIWYGQHSATSEDIETIVRKIMENQSAQIPGGPPAALPGAPESALADNKRLEEELTKAVRLLREGGLDPARRAEAEKELTQGNAHKADAILAGIEKSRAGKAAEAAKARGAIAFMNHPQAALEHYLRAADYDPEDSATWNQIGILRHRLGELAGAEEAWQRVLLLAQAAGDKAMRVTALGNLGINARVRGELGKAEEYLKRALALAEELSSKERMAAALGNLGLIALTRGEPEKAEEYLQRALALSEALGHKEGMAIQLGNLGLIAQDRGDLGQAEAYHRRALDLNEELGRKGGMAIQLGNLGLIALTRGESEQAEEYHRRALALSEALGSKESMANQLANLGLITRARGDVAGAEAYWRRALALFTQVGMKPQIEQTKGLLREIGAAP